jgi:hypothetical protein
LEPESTPEKKTRALLVEAKSLLVQASKLDPSVRPLLSALEATLESGGTKPTQKLCYRDILVKSLPQGKRPPEEETEGTASIVVLKVARAEGFELDQLKVRGSIGNALGGPRVARVTQSTKGNIVLRTCP